MELRLDTPGLLEALLNSVSDYAVMVVDREGRIRVWSPGAEQLFGFRSEQMLGQSMEMLFTPEDIEDGVFRRELDTVLDHGRALDLRWLLRSDGTRVWSECALTALLDPAGALAGYVKIARDATERKHDQERILQLARVDPLTGFANRTALDERLREVSDQALREHSSFLVFMLDLDRFKAVNDRHGHRFGDLLLQEAARRIGAELRGSDLLARIGGDEFVVVVPHVQEPTVGARLAARIIDTLDRSFLIDGVELKIGASIGISVFPQDTADLHQLLHMADLALYKAKSDAHGGYHFFTRDLDARAHRRNRLQRLLHKALQAQAFELHYQPQIDVRTGRVVGAEALLRCRYRPLVDEPISDLIAVARQSGLLREISYWVLEQACEDLQAWREAGVPELRMCLNFCAGELDDAGLVDRVTQTLERHGLAARELEVEVTEHELFNAEGHGSGALLALHRLGVSISIDDFGTGYSSLGRLIELPVDRVKLDRSFVRNIPLDAQSCTVAEAIVVLARTLHLDVIGEGIETTAQADFLENVSCDIQQGYFHGRPMSGPAMAVWLAQGTAGHSTH